MIMELLALSPKDLPKEEKIEIPRGVNVESINSTVESLKSQMEYYWQTLFENPPTAKIDVLSKEEGAILIRISAEDGSP